MKQFNLKEIERRAYRSTFEDGLFDIFYGCLIILLGTTALIDKAGISAPLKYFIIMSEHQWMVFMHFVLLAAVYLYMVFIY